MAISDEHVRTMRACLVDPDEFQRRATRLERSHDLRGYLAMLAGTLVRLSRRRFGDADDRAGEVVRWVARVRAREAASEGAGDSADSDDPDPLNPVAAEQMLFQLLGLESRYAEFGEEARGDTQYAVLLLLYEDLDLDDDQLDQLLTEARTDAEQAMGPSDGESTE